MAFPKRQLFLCCNENDDGSGCGAFGTDKAAKALKESLKAEGKWGEVRVTRTQCMGQCARGPVGVLYPEGRWIMGESATDQQELRELLLSSDRSGG